MSNSWDVYCFLTGAKFMNSREEVRDDIVRRLGGGAGFRLSKAVAKGLVYSKEDVEFSDKYVMICHYERLENGGIKPLARFSAAEPSQYTPATITAIFNVTPGVFPDHGEYLNEDPTDDDPGLYRIHPRATPAFLITHGAYLILKQAAPSLEPPDLYKLYRSRCRNAVDYGPVNGITGERNVFWPGLCSTERSPNPDYTLNRWREILSEKGKNDDEILYNAWKGSGNLWALVRPDRFPIGNTPMEVPSYTYDSLQPKAHMFKLPLEVQLLICECLHPKYMQALMSTCKAMSLRLAVEINHIVYRYVRECEPWYLPAGPFNFPNGNQEVDWWNSEWVAKGLSGDNLESCIPWLRYRRACSHSISMWNRIRIWQIAKQLEMWNNEFPW